MKNMVSIKNVKTLKYQTLFKKALVHSIICSKCGSKDEKIFKEGENQLKFYKFMV